MKAKNLFYFIILLVCIGEKATQANLSDMIYTDSWKFLKDKFITIPNAQPWNTIPILLQSGGSVLVGTGVGAGLLKIHEKFIKLEDDFCVDYTEAQENFAGYSFQLILPIAFGAGCFAYYKMHTMLIRRAQRAQLKDLLENWSILSSRIPLELKSGLEQLYKEYKTNPRYVAFKFDEIVRVLVLQINEKFAEKNSEKSWISDVLKNAPTIGSILAKVTKLIA